MRVRVQALVDAITPEAQEQPVEVLTVNGGEETFVGVLRQQDDELVVDASWPNAIVIRAHTGS